VSNRIKEALLAYNLKYKVNIHKKVHPQRVRRKTPHILRVTSFQRVWCGREMGRIITLK
jgi:hypothetical protein